MAAINDLIAQIEDPELRTRIQAEVDRMSKQKKFGLVFEEHLPECTPLYDVPVKRGAAVAQRAGNVSDIYKVMKVHGDEAVCQKRDSDAFVSFKLNELVTVTEFGEPIYPYLKPIDSICRAPDSDLWHTLIEADNYHALQLLEYLYAGKVDCIYIDPPYNSGARDWKYNNDYVDGADSYRHSKWLSFMRKRLEIARKLLNPMDSVLIVTIDDKEYMHLGCLLEEMFADAKITMVSSVINPAGKAKKGGVDFSRTDEYLFFLQIGHCPVLPETRELVRTPIAWEAFRRHSLANSRGKHGAGACGPNQFYPFYIDDTTHEIVEIGEAIAEGVDRRSVKQIPGCTTVFPIRDNGIEMNWGAVRETAAELYAKGYLRVGSYTPDKPQPYSIVYLTKGTIKSIENGDVVITEFDEKGIKDGYFPGGKPKVPTTNWNKPAHNATSYGTDLLNKILKGARFDYPKSLYAVRDCLALFLAEKKDALVLDFFAGSGTTLHALNLLNAEDGGRRRGIMVTNNEVSAADAATLTQAGHTSGDDAWHALGIARYVTWPRTVCAVRGVDVDGQPLSGHYGVKTEEYIADENATVLSKTTGKPLKTKIYHKVKTQLYPEAAKIAMADGFSANVTFFQLGFLDKDSVMLGKHFGEMLPILWMKAGAIGKCPAISEDIPDMLILPENKFAVLIDETSYMAFEKRITEYPEIKTIYIVTDSEPGYREMIAAFEGKDTYPLYRNYLDHFRTYTGR